MCAATGLRGSATCSVQGNRCAACVFPQVVDAPTTTSNSGSGGKTPAPDSTGTSSSGSVYPSRGVWAHSFVGTPNYLAPEMVACEGYGFKADIWAAGCVLYEMAALKPAFRVSE